MSNDNECCSIGTSLVVFLLGVAVGATVAILYAPSAGSETRAHIAETAGRVKERAAEISHQVAEKASELREKVAAKVQTAAASSEAADTTS